MSQLFFLLLLLPILSWGRDQLDTIHVDGDKNPQSYSFGDTQFIDQKQIKQSGSPFLGELLKSVPSIMTVQNGGPGGRQSYFLRGTESRQLTIVILILLLLLRLILKKLLFLNPLNLFFMGVMLLGELLFLKLAKGQKITRTQAHSYQSGPEVFLHFSKLFKTIGEIKRPKAR